MQAEDDFVPFTQWKPYHTMTFVDYEFTIKGKNIVFDERVLPEQLDVKEGERFTVQIDQFGRVMLIKD